jgi:beta-lactamase class A
MIFNRKKEEDIKDVEDDDLEEEVPLKPRKIRDLNPENKKARKEPVKPWGAKERLFVLITFLLTVVTSGALALSARNFKLPKMPQLKLPSLSEINPFKEQVIVVGNKGNKVSAEKIERVKKLFKEATNDYSGLYAFYIYDLNGDYYYGYNHKEVMQAASLIKLPVMYLTFKEIEKGNIDRNTYESELEAMGKRSDNSAFIRTVNTLGRENISKTTYELGMPNTSLSENLTTPEEVGLFFKKLYKGEILSGDDTNKFEKFLTDTNFEKWLRPGIPENITVFHKYGREVHSVSDAGVVLSKNPFVIVIMTDGVIEKEADALFPNLAKLLYDEHTRVENK